MINEKMRALGAKRSVIRELFEYGKIRKAEIGEENVFDFSLGNPSVPAPDEVNAEIVRMVSEESSILLHGYTSAQGDAGVRQAIADYINKTQGESVHKDCLYMTVGAAAALTCSLTALVSPGEEVIVPSPYFPEYKVFIERCGGSGSKVTLAGVLLSLASAASYAFYIVAVKKSAMKNLSSTKLTFYTLVFGSLLYLLRLDCGASMRVPCDWFAWLCLVGVAFFPTIIALAFMAISIAKAGATPTAILGVLEPVTGLMVGVLIFGERLNLLNIAGIILIFVSVMLIVCPGDKNSSQEPAE